MPIILFIFSFSSLSTIQETRDAYVKRLNGIYSTNLGKSNVDVIEGYAKFVNSNTVEVNGQQYSGKHILIATGGKPTVPDIPGKALL